MLMEHFDDLVTDRALRLADVRMYAAQGEVGRRYQNRYWVNATSGSSGHPGFFVFNDAEWATIDSAVRFPHPPLALPWPVARPLAVFLAAAPHSAPLRPAST